MFDHYNQIEKYRENLVYLTNSSGLTVGTAYYVLKDVLHELYLVYMQQKDTEDEYQDEEYQETIDIDPEQTKIEDVSKEALMEELENETN